MKQITIITGDRAGILSEICEVLGTAGVNIEDVAAEGVSGTMVAILLVDRYDEALRVLAAAGYKAVTEDALVVKLEDKPGELARITRRFKDANLNLRSARTIRRWNGQCFVALATEQLEEARALVKDVLVS